MEELERSRCTVRRKGRYASSTDFQALWLITLPYLEATNQFLPKADRRDNFSVYRAVIALLILQPNLIISSSCI